MDAQAEAARQRVVKGWTVLTGWMVKFLPMQLKCVSESVERTWLSESLKSGKTEIGHIQTS